MLVYGAYFLIAFTYCSMTSKEIILATVLKFSGSSLFFIVLSGLFDLEREKIADR
jgi:hypothetical protein